MLTRRRAELKRPGELASRSKESASLTYRQFSAANGLGSLGFRVLLTTPRANRDQAAGCWPAASQPLLHLAAREPGCADVGFGARLRMYVSGKKVYSVSGI